MKKLIAVGVAACSLACLGSQKVDELWDLVKSHEKVDLSSPEGDKIRNAIEARQNALSPEEKKEFEQKLKAVMIEQMKQAMKRFTAIPIDTPAAKVDFFEDDTNSVDSVFGVPFGTKVDKEIVTPGSDAGPLSLLANETRLKIPKPVKWFTTVSGQPDMRNKRIYSLMFKAEVLDSMSEDELQKGIEQLERLMTVKFGKDCIKGDRSMGDFTVKITDSRKIDEELDAKYPQRKKDREAASFKIPRSLTLYVENRRISKLDSEIPEPNDGDGFADNLKIPEGLQLTEPEPYDHNKPERKFEDDELFAKSLANPQPNYREMIKQLAPRFRKLFSTKHDLAIAYFRKNPLWSVGEYVGETNGEVLNRAFWAGDQFATLEVITAVLPKAGLPKASYNAKAGCKSPKAGWYALAVEFGAELDKLEKLKDESEIDAVLPHPKKYNPPKADFKLIDGMQGGIYKYQATVNVDEDGDVYLRAYEVTKGTRLSADRMRQRTTEKIIGKGEHTIGVGKEFTIYEGDWGKFYAARLEIWFVPANGGKPRKLKEKLFKVQGWMF